MQEYPTQKTDLDYTNQQSEQLSNIENFDYSSKFSDIESDMQIRGILADLVEGDFNKRSEIRAGVLLSFLDKYPNAQLYETDLPVFLNKILINNGQEKMDQYKLAGDRLKQVIYGNDNNSETNIGVPNEMWHYKSKDDSVKILTVEDKNKKWPGLYNNDGSDKTEK